MKELDIWHNMHELRGSTHGHLPLTKDIIDFFKRVSKLVKPKNILEFGTNLGGSAAVQLAINPKANLVSFDPQTWEIHSAVYAEDSFIKNHKKLFGKTPAVGLLHLVFKDRFTFHNRSSKWVLDLVDDTEFDYAFIDGSHTYLDAYNDIQNCIDLGIKYLAVDNIATDEDAVAKRVQVRAAVEQFDNLEEVDSVEYAITHPITEKITHDKCVLYKVKV